LIETRFSRTTRIVKEFDAEVAWRVLHQSNKTRYQVLMSEAEKLSGFCTDSALVRKAAVRLNGHFFVVFC
jgi:hypothetical protein